MEQFVANGLCRGSVYALVALGFGLIYTTSRVFHVAHGFVFAAACYALYATYSLANLPLAVSIACALATAVALGVLLEMVVYGPLLKRGASPEVLLISSFGAYIAGVNVLALLFGSGTKTLRSGLEDSVRFGDVLLTRTQLLQLICGAGVGLAYFLFLRWSALGRTCRAVADDATLASVLGVRAAATRSFALGLGSLLAAIGGVLIAMDVGMDPHVGMPVMLTSAIACIVGGLHHFHAPALGGLLLGVLQSLVVWQTSAYWESGVTYGMLILLLLFRPQGLLGRAVRAEEVR